ncbi:hypothetical protein V8D89_005726 [Ganoderma adspersum]
MSDLDSDSPLLRPGAVARTPFGTPFFALFKNPAIDARELCKLRVSVKLREELAAWEKLQRTGEGTLSDNTSTDTDMDTDTDTGRSSPGEQPQDDSPSFAGGLPGTGTARQARVVPNYFEFVDDGDGDDTAAELWPDTYYTGDDNEDVDCEVDGFVFIHRAHATGSVFWNHTRPRPSPSPGPRGRARQRRHRNLNLKGVDAQYRDGPQHQVGRVGESTAVWSYFVDLLRPVGEMDW